MLIWVQWLPPMDRLDIEAAFNRLTPQTLLLSVNANRNPIIFINNMLPESIN